MWHEAGRSWPKLRQLAGRVGWPAGIVTVVAIVDLRDPRTKCGSLLAARGSNPAPASKARYNIVQ